MVEPGTQAALYILVGKERFLKEEFVGQLKAKLFPKGDPSALNFQSVHAEKGVYPGDFTEAIGSKNASGARRWKCLGH